MSQHAVEIAKAFTLTLVKFRVLINRMFASKLFMMLMDKIPIMFINQQGITSIYPKTSTFDPQVDLLFDSEASISLE